MKIEWRDVFDCCKIYPSDFNECIKIVKSVGYTYFSFNGRVYSIFTEGVKDYKCGIEDLI